MILSFCFLLPHYRRTQLLGFGTKLKQCEHFNIFVAAGEMDDTCTVSVAPSEEQSCGQGFRMKKGSLMWHM